MQQKKVKSVLLDSKVSLLHVLMIYIKLKPLQVYKLYLLKENWLLMTLNNLTLFSLVYKSCCQ